MVECVRGREFVRLRQIDRARVLVGVLAKRPGRALGTRPPHYVLCINSHGHCGALFVMLTLTLCLTSLACLRSFNSFCGLRQFFPALPVPSL